MFKLKKVLISENVPVTLLRTAMNLFNALVVPICTYGSEVWGVSINIKNIFKRCDNFPQEKVLLHFAKFVLGVNRKSCNATIRGELGL